MEAFAKKKGKEGTRGASQIIHENAATLTFYRNMILGANGLYFATMTLLGRNYFAFDIVMFLISAAVNICCFQMMRSMGQSGSDSGPGLDLNMEGGIAEHLKDLIILTAGSQALSLLSSWLWLLLLLAPARALLKLWTGVIAPWIFQPADEGEEVNEKKQKKLDRKMKRSMR